MVILWIIVGVVVAANVALGVWLYRKYRGEQQRDNPVPQQQRRVDALIPWPGSYQSDPGYLGRGDINRSNWRNNDRAGVDGQ